MSEPHEINSNITLRNYISQFNNSSNNFHENVDFPIVMPEYPSYAKLDSNKPLETITDVGKYEEKSKLDYSYNRLIHDMENKMMLLDSIRRENEEMEKLKRSRVDEKPSEVPYSLKVLVEARHQELVELIDQQIEDLMIFEEDVQNLVMKFPKDSADSEVKSLREQVDTLQANLAKKMTELRQYKEDIWENFGCQSMEESIVFINSVNDKLTRSVEQMTKEIRRVQSEVSSFNFVRATASSIILSVVNAQDQV